MTTSTPITMFALGSSFAAGPGISPVADKAAMRSMGNYPHRLAELLGARLVDTTISGATTSTILDSRQRLGLNSFAPQLESLAPDADLVTVTVGGNDLGYLGGMLTASLRNAAAGLPVLRKVPRLAPSGEARLDTATLKAATDGLVRIGEAVHARAPQAQLVYVGYLPILEEDPTLAEASHLTAADVARFRGVADALAEVYATAARRTRALLVAPDDYPRGHGLGTMQPWVQGLNFPRGIGGSFHPNAEGMQAVAQTVHERLSMR